MVGITNFLVALNTIILIPILSKSFSATDYGIYVQVLTTFFLLTNIANLGLPYTLVRFLSVESDIQKIKEIFYSMTVLILILGIVISMILFLFSNEIANSLFNGNVNVAKVISVLILVGSLNSLFIDFFVALKQMKRYSLLLLFQTYLNLILLSYLAFSGLNISVLVLGFFISQIIFLVVMFSLIYKEIGFIFPKFDNLKDFLNFALPIIPNNLSTWIVESSDKYVIGIILGTTFVAYYSPGYTIGMAILLFFTPISVLLLSILPKYYENGQIKEVMLYINYSLKYFLLVAIPSVFVLSILSKSILMIISTQQIAANGYMITPFIAISAVLFGTYGIIMNLIILEKKTKIIGSIWTIAALISILNIFLVPLFGIIAAAVVTLISYLTAFVIGIIYSRSFFKFYFDYNFILKSLLASVLISIPLLIISPNGVVSILIMIIISTLVYFVLIILMRGINKKELDFFKSMMNN